MKIDNLFNISLGMLGGILLVMLSAVSCAVGQQSEKEKICKEAHHKKVKLETCKKEGE